MARRAIAVEGEGALGQRVVTAHDANVFTAVEPLLRERHRLTGLRPRRQVGEHGGKVANRQIDRFQVEQAARVARGERHHPDRDARRIAVHDLNQARHQLGSGGVRHGQHKGGGGLFRDKVAGRDDLLQLAQCFAHGGPQRQRPRRRRHHLAAAFDQFISHRFPEPAQRVAHRRLRDGELERGPGQAAFGHDFVENTEQVQVECLEIGGIHGSIKSLI